MQIGKVIRKYRKNKNMTQEEMAERLGVTAPAVNKWENGNSMPDIMLLAPIARLLNITLDTLLSFREELTEDEINGLIMQADNLLKNKPYEEAFQWAREKLEMYPNCEQLIIQMAVVLDAWRMINNVPDSEKYEEFIKNCYIRVLDSEDENVRNLAADTLFGFYSRKDQYEKAEEYLRYFSEQNPERKRKQAFIYSKTNRVNEAYKAYEELLFTSYQMISSVLNNIYMLAVDDGNMQKAHELVNKQQELAKIFEMGEFYEASCRLNLAVTEKDVDTTIEVMERMIAGITNINNFCNSALYEHMTFKESKSEFSKELEANLLKNFCDEQIFGFLKEDKRWHEIIKLAQRN